MNGIWVLVGTALGGVLGLAATRHPGWVLEHPGTVLLFAIAAVGSALVAVQLRMNAHERGHELRAEAFALAMREQFATAHAEALEGRAAN